MSYSQTLYAVLIDVAKAESLITYRQVAQRIHIPLENEADVAHLSQILGEISTREHHEERPLLSVVVVQGEWAGKPNQSGDGFF